MEKLYYEDQYLKEFVAEVIEIKEVNGRYHVVLDKTAFFPGGGGQHNDLGFIGDHEVIDVYEDNGEIYHVVEKKPIKIHRVKCKIDWERRLDGMQQHLAQHVLSGCFFTLFNANTVSVHVGKEIATVDIKGIVSEEMIRKAESYANDAIQRNLKVEMYAPTKAELKKIKIRRDLPQTDNEIRIVSIEDLDVNACCGVHPSSTLDLGIIKIKKWEKHKGNTRIEYLAGKRAVLDYIKTDEFSASICRFLSCGEEDALKTIKNLNNKLKELQDENRSINAELADYQVDEMIKEAEVINDIAIIKKVYAGGDIRTLSRLSDKITSKAKAISLFAIDNGEKANLIFTCSKNIKGISMNEILKDAITLIDGKGGGSIYQAQGGGKGANNLESSLNYAEMKIKNMVK